MKPAIVPNPEARSLAAIDRAAWACAHCRGHGAQCSDWRECMSSAPKGKLDAQALAAMRAEQLFELTEQGKCVKQAAHLIGVSHVTARRYSAHRKAA